jgi:hypothetical protein
VAIARQYAAATGDREFAERAELFSKATKDPGRFWKGEFGALPAPADFGHGDQDGYTYFDHLVGEGDLEKVLGFINRFRLGRRISDLQSMKAIGNLSEFAALADQLLPGLRRPDAIVLARLLIDEELSALRAVANGEGGRGGEARATETSGRPRRDSRIS